ncbi:hypothetical protein GCM10020331_016180 [Ectobacillus funiculus]
MTTMSRPGFGVFHGPIYELANRHLQGRAINITGSSFETVLFHLGQQKNQYGSFQQAPSKEFPHGIGGLGKHRKVQSLLPIRNIVFFLTGYDNQYVYFNDPLANIKNRRFPLASFIRGWEQYGKQAITYK